MSTWTGTLPERKPGIFTDSARSDAACSTACFTCAPGTSTVRRTRFCATSSTWVSTRPFCQCAASLPRSCELALEIAGLRRRLAPQDDEAGEPHRNRREREDGDREPAVRARRPRGRLREDTLAAERRVARVRKAERPDGETGEVVDGCAQSRCAVAQR